MGALCCRACVCQHNALCDSHKHNTAKLCCLARWLSQMRHVHILNRAHKQISCQSSWRNWTGLRMGSFKLPIFQGKAGQVVPGWAEGWQGAGGQADSTPHLSGSIWLLPSPLTKLIFRGDLSLRRPIGAAVALPQGKDCPSQW